MGVTESFSQIWTWIVSSTFQLFNSFVIPGTFYTVLGLFVELLLIVLILKIIGHWLGFQTDMFREDYKASRKSGYTPGRSFRVAKNRASVRNTPQYVRTVRNNYPKSTSRR